MNYAFNPERIPVALLILALLGFLAYSYFFSRSAVIKRKLKKAIRMRVNEFRDGDIAKVVGVVEIEGEPLLAPLSGRPCCYYHVTVEQRVQSGKSSSWRTIIDEEFGGDILLRDGDDLARLSGNAYTSLIVKDRDFSSGFLNDATPELEAYLSSDGTESENVIGMNKSLRYKEGILEAGESISAIGQGYWKIEDHPQGRRKVLELIGLASEPIVVSDDPDTLEGPIAFR